MRPRRRKIDGSVADDQIFIVVELGAKDEVADPRQRIGAAVTLGSGEEVTVRLELGEAGVEIIFERATQENPIRVRMIGAKHSLGKSVKADWIIVGPGHSKSERLGELLQIDQGRSGVNPDGLWAEE